MFKLDKITKGIYHLSFDNPIHLNHHFMRFQEIYESPNENFKDKPFQLMDFIVWYTTKDKKSNHKSFNYNCDWCGFNIPVPIITQFYEKLTDKNDHDHFMMQIANYIIRDHGSDNCYLIGSSKSAVTMKHEVAHGLFYTNIKYQLEALSLVKSLSADKRNFTFNEFTKIGYNKEVLYDELQAYFATGLTEELRVKITSKDTKPFRDLFNKYYGKIK